MRITVGTSKDLDMEGKENQRGYKAPRAKKDKTVAEAECHMLARLLNEVRLQPLLAQAQLAQAQLAAGTGAGRCRPLPLLPLPQAVLVSNILNGHAGMLRAALKDEQMEQYHNTRAITTHVATRFACVFLICKSLMASKVGPPTLCSSFAAALRTLPARCPRCSYAHAALPALPCPALACRARSGRFWSAQTSRRW
jgi:hypothetical protein